MTASASLIGRHYDARRLATLLATVRHLEARSIDDALELLAPGRNRLRGQRRGRAGAGGDAGAARRIWRGGSQGSQASAGADFRAAARPSPGHDAAVKDPWAGRIGSASAARAPAGPYSDSLTHIHPA